MPGAGRGNTGEHGIKGAELGLLGESILIDPPGERLQPCGVQVDGAALGIPATGDQFCLFKDPNMLRDGLLADLEGVRQFVDRGRPPAQAGDDAAPNRIGQGQEGPVEAVVLCASHGTRQLFFDKPLGCSKNRGPEAYGQGVLPAPTFGR